MRSLLQLPVQINPNRLEAGIDEVGRGCLAGPVVSAAVILPHDTDIIGLRDSKKLSEKKRNALALEIKEKAITYSIGIATPEEIDQINILQATFVAMHCAIKGLSPQPDFMLIDGNRFKTELDIPYQTIIKGDDTYQCIAAASVLAKVYRDQLMISLHQQYPHYDWEHNVGYGTPKHLSGIQQYGITPYHRRSFAPCQPTLFDQNDKKIP